MSANFPSGVSDNGVDTSSRANNAANKTYNETNNTAKEASATLRNDLTTLKNDLDALLSTASTMTERELRDAYARMMTKFSSLRYAAKGMAAQAGKQFNQSVDMTTDYVKERPLQSVAIAAGVGLVLGVLLGRR
jgi:ElaB/YqjD/DUF883 family membrane-anchored ribosome-binding protein